MGGRERDSNHEQLERQEGMVGGDGGGEGRMTLREAERQHMKT